MESTPKGKREEGGKGGEKRTLISDCLFIWHWFKGANLVLSGSGNKLYGEVFLGCPNQTSRRGALKGASGSLVVLGFGSQKSSKPAQLCSPSPRGTFGGRSSVTEHRGPPEHPVCSILTSRRTGMLRPPARMERTDVISIPGRSGNRRLVFTFGE